MIRVTVHVHPSVGHDQVTALPDGSLEVWLRARPVEGQANEALIALLASCLGVKRREVTLLRGHQGRTKLVELALASLADVVDRLGRAKR